MISFGKRLRMTRKSLQLTQAELAEKLTVSVQSISKWECDSSMPDISQIVPLAAALGVTTDFLLGVGDNEKEDRDKLCAEIDRINKGIDAVYSRCDDAFHKCYQLYKDHIKRYPLDFEIKLLCADSIVRCLYYETKYEEEKDKLYQEALLLLESVINCDRDTTRLIDARQLLVVLYLYKNDFVNADATVVALPQKGSIRTAMEIEINSQRNDLIKCVELSEIACSEAVHHYLWALAVRAKRISLLGNHRKSEVIPAWRALVDAAKSCYDAFHDIKINTKWLYSALNNLSNDYIAISEIDCALDVIEELTSILIDDYNECKKRGNVTVADEIKNNFLFYLHSCHSNNDTISNDRRFKKCEEMLGCILSQI